MLFLHLSNFRETHLLHSWKSSGYSLLLSALIGGSLLSCYFFVTSFSVVTAFQAHTKQRQNGKVLSHCLAAAAVPHFTSLEPLTLLVR